eukprot:TRINITY_DN15023_c0_g1_i1.p1 TRINITY_DN15023_c0_g1~~TRINITY_DN15023_c0_g1_i1.p1  ORF type:complete len:234 (-),score=47.74 TRINITY_DN15023_c0_g1_i1:38-691(-)
MQNKQTLRLKIYFNGEVRRISVPEHQFTLVHLQTFVELLFRIRSSSYTLKYEDNEGDLITLFLDEDVQELLLQQSSPFPQPLIHIHIIPKSTNSIFIPEDQSQTDQPFSQIASEKQFQKLQEQAIFLAKSDSEKDLHRSKILFKRLVRYSPKQPTLHYNMAIVECRLKNEFGAIGALHRAVDAGFSNLHHLLNNRFLSSLHQNVQFGLLLNRLLETD